MSVGGISTSLRGETAAQLRTIMTRAGEDPLAGSRDEAERFAYQTGRVLELFLYGAQPPKPGVNSLATRALVVGTSLDPLVRGATQAIYDRMERVNIRKALGALDESKGYPTSGDAWVALLHESKGLPNEAKQKLIERARFAAEELRGLGYHITRQATAEDIIPRYSEGKDRVNIAERVEAAIAELQATLRDG